MTAHIVHINTTSDLVQDDVIGIDNGLCMSPIRIVSRNKYPQHMAVIKTIVVGMTQRRLTRRLGTDEANVGSVTIYPSYWKAEVNPLLPESLQS